MHEFALIQDMLEKTLEEMKKKQAVKVTVIELSVGKSSGYSPESLKQAYELLVADTELDGAELVIKDIEGRDVILSRLVMEE